MELYEGICGVDFNGKLENKPVKFLGFSGLALYYDYNFWNITHIGTGKCIDPNACAKEFAKAASLGEKVAGLIDWTKPTFQELASQVFDWQEATGQSFRWFLIRGGE